MLCTSDWTVARYLDSFRLDDQIIHLIGGARDILAYYNHLADHAHAPSPNIIYRGEVAQNISRSLHEVVAYLRF